MTIMEYLTDLEKDKHRSASGKTLKEALIETTPIWSNDAAKGYAIRAMKKAGLDPDQIRAVLRELRYAFDDLTVEEAEQISEKF